MFYPSIVLLLMVISHANCEDSLEIDPSKIANFINEDPHSIWKADTYGLNKDNVNEFVRGKLGTKMDHHPHEPYLRREMIKQDEANVPATDSLPANFTWISTNRTKCRIGRIKNQANCGSCWAVASVAAFSDRLCIKSEGNITTPLSAEYLMTCHPTNYGCGGGYMYYTYTFLKENGTITGGEYDSDEGCQPYSIRPCGFPTDMPCASANAYTPRCKQKKCTNDWYHHRTETNTYKVSSWYYLNTEYYMLRDIYDYGPISATFWVYPDFLLYKKGIYIHKVGWWPLGGHAVEIVGWGIENGVKYWHVANSWGKDWGEDGYFRIRRGTSECSIEYGMIGVIPSLNSTLA